MTELRTFIHKYAPYTYFDFNKKNPSPLLPFYAVCQKLAIKIGEDEDTP